MAMTLIHNDQLVEPAIAVLPAAPPTRHASWTARARDSAVERSSPPITISTARTVPSASCRPSSLAMATSTSAWKSAWFSHRRLMTEALVSRTPAYLLDDATHHHNDAAHYHHYHHGSAHYDY